MKNDRQGYPSMRYPTGARAAAVHPEEGARPGIAGRTRTGGPGPRARGGGARRGARSLPADAPGGSFNRRAGPGASGRSI